MHIIALNIQPRWLIEENVIIFRNEVWFNPPKEPIIADKIIVILKRILKLKYEINIRGAIFCQVIKVNELIQVKPSITVGNQKWKGAAPLFNNKAEKIIIFEYKIWLFNSYGTLNFSIERIIANNKIADANAWVKKYFKEASVDIRLLLSFIRGINDNRLISNPIQALNHELEEIVIIVPNIKIK